MLTSNRSAGMLSTRLVPILAAAGLLAGCPDPEKRFDEFESRIPDARVIVNYDAPLVNEIPDITGTALLTIRVVGQNVQARVDWTLTPQGDQGTIDMTLRLLSVAGRELVGDTTTINNIAVDNTASFTIGPVSIPIVAAATILGTDLNADNLVLKGRILNEDFTCGVVDSGTVRETLTNLAGGTFGSVRATPGATGDALPQAVAACPQ